MMLPLAGFIGIGAIVDRLETVEQEVSTLRAEVGTLRRRLRLVDAETIAALLAYVYDAFGTDEWTAALLLEASLDHAPLRGAVVACVGRKPGVYRLSRFIGRHVGSWGEFVLHCVNPHTRDGVTYSVTSSQKSHDSVEAEGDTP